MKIKKLFAVLIALAVVFGVAGCKQPTDDAEETPAVKLPNLTIKNESSFDLTDVKFSGISFAAANSTDLPKTTQAVKQLTENEINNTGFITFVRKDIGIACRVSQVLAIEDTDYTFTFLDTTLVEEIAKTGNKKPLSAISFVSKLTVERSGINIPRNDIVNLGEVTINTAKQVEFTLKNTGVGKLLLDGSEPVKITSVDANVFSVIQPAGSTIEPGDLLTFKINFNAAEQKLYSGTVTVSSSDEDGDFIFTVKAAGVTPKPIASVFYGETEIAQNGTIDAGEALITQSANITVEIRNTGTETLAIDTANITITGADSTAFTRTTTPGSSVSAGNKTSFVINCAPVNVGENNAILTIPTNDESRNPVIVFLKTSGVKGAAVLELSQGGTVIENNSLAPVDFGTVDLGGSPKNMTFTIKNTGNIALELTGNPLTVESSNVVFTVPSQPSVKTLAPGESVPFIARYTPTAEQEDTGTITIMNNGSAMDFSFTVKGNGHEKKPQITVTQGASAVDSYSQYDFGTVATDENKEIVFTIGNSGDAALTFEVVDGNRINLTENASGYFAVINQPTSNTVAPGGSASFAVRYKPTVEGTNYTATIGIKTNSRENDDFCFYCTGDSYQKQPQITVMQGESTINPSGEYDFGTITQNTTQEITFTITNSGETNLTFANNDDGNRIYLEDDTASAFAVTVQPLETTVLTPGTTAEFTVIFIPPAEGTYLATVAVSTNSHENALLYFRVKGVGRGYQIGDTGPAGGLIFYDKGDFTSGWRYLEAASSTTETEAHWGAYYFEPMPVYDYVYYNVSGLQEGVGVGETNTTVIVNFVSSKGEAGRAAQICSSLVSGGYSDWFLPSKSELALMYTNLKGKGLGNFKSASYWSSSQYDNEEAWAQDFWNGRQASHIKNGESVYVRAIRAF